MEIMHKKKQTEAGNSGQAKDVSSMEENDSWNPPYPPCAPAPCKDMISHIKLIKEWMAKKEALLAASRATHTIIPDRTPESMNDAFFDKLCRLGSILEKDSAKRFLNLFDHDKGGLAWGYVITPQTFNQMIVQNAVRCAKVVLEGNAPELNGHRANPNYMNQSGYFPLHEAAEMFSADMIKLLLHYGASANLRTAGPDVVEGLLPLHVAVGNACRHKFLEENLLPDQEYRDYVSMPTGSFNCCAYLKWIFLDTVRLIAERTDDLLAEVWKYIKDGKLAETTVLLLAAQKKIRTGSSFKENGSCTTHGDGFMIISNLCIKDVLAINLEIAQNRKRKKPKVERNLRHRALNLVYVISEAGEALDSYIRAHPKVPRAMQVCHVEVLERVSSILKNHGFFPTGECINIRNLGPYEQQLSRLSDEELPEKHDMCTILEKAIRKKQPRGWELEYTRRSFFRHRNSVLSQLQEDTPMIRLQSIQETLENWNERSSPIPNNNVGLLGRIPQLTRNQQSRRLFGTAASTVLKLLKHA